MSRVLFAVLFIVLLSPILNAQSKGSLLVIINVNSYLNVDGEELGAVDANKPTKFELMPGEHYVQIRFIEDESINKDEVIVIEADKQKIFKVELNITNAKVKILPVLVADLSFNISGIMTVSTWQNNNPGKTYPNNPVFAYAFEKGDEIDISFSMLNDKGTNIIKVYTYPDMVEKYSNNAFTALNDVRIKVEEKGIYIFSLSTNHTFDRSCKMKIKRIPASEDTKQFNTNVEHKEVYTPVIIEDTQNFFVNSGSNATFKGGKSRITFPVNLPTNTVEWYYVFSASRDEAQINQVAKEFSLLSDLTKLIDETGSIGFAITSLTKPPGANYCDIYLINYDNVSLFESKVQYNYYLSGSRENIMSGIVKINDLISGTYYLGIKNPDSMYGVHVAIQVVAIVKEKKYVMSQQ